MVSLDAKFQIAAELIEKEFSLLLVHGITAEGNCTCGKPDCSSPGKHPVHGGWRERVTKDVAQLQPSLLANPSLNLGIATGTPSGVFAVDIDVQHAGDRSWEELLNKYGDVPNTLTCATGGGGQHLFFRIPEHFDIANSVGKLSKGIDIRGDGGYVVAAGSSHVSGRDYALLDASAPIAEAPDWLLDLLKNPPIPSSTALVPFLPGRRNTDMFSLACSMRRKGATADLIEAALIVVNDKLGLPLPISEIGAIARSAMRYDPAATLDLSDRGLSEQLAERSNLKHGYAPELGWLHYREGKWQSDPEGLLIQEAAKVFVADIEQKIRAEAHGMANPSDSEKAIKTVRRCQGASAIRNMVRLASSDPKIYTPAASFDAVTHLFNVLNGTLDLRTFQLIPHDPNHRLRKQANVEFDSQATCPVFDKFIDDILPPDVRDYMFRVTGYGLLGTAEEQVMFFLHGTRRNGKSTFINALRNILGDYATVVEPTALQKKINPGINNEIARLNNVRVAFTSEFASGAVIDAALLKRLTGTEAVSARFLYREPIEFVPRAVFHVATNHLPIIDGSDKAIARRIRIIPFEKTIPASAVDLQLGAKLEAEKSGILNRIIGGLRDYRTKGLNPPARVVELTSEYIAESDFMGAFLAERCIERAGGKVSLKALYETFSHFCLMQGVPVVSAREFGRGLRQRGLPRRRLSTGYVIEGIGLRPQAEWNDAA